MTDVDLPTGDRLGWCRYLAADTTTALTPTAGSGDAVGDAARSRPTGDTNNLNWSFNLTQALNYLAAGQKLTLTYTVKANDSQSVGINHAAGDHCHHRQRGLRR